MRVWTASLLFYGAIFALCELLRLFASRLFRFTNFKLAGVEVHTLVLEFIGTIQVCAPMFDVNAVLEHYGLAGVLVEISFIEVCNALLLRNAFADPCQLFGCYVKKKFDALVVGTLLVVQFGAAYASYLIARTFWRMQLNFAHAHYLRDDCNADLTVTIAYGSLMEAGGFLALKLSELALERSLFDENTLHFLGALASGVITVFGINLTGMYANPIVAWACTFNCGDVSHVAHFIVYWAAPLAAWFVTDRLIAPTVNKE